MELCLWDLGPIRTFSFTTGLMSALFIVLLCSKFLPSCVLCFLCVCLVRWFGLVLRPAPRDGEEILSVGGKGLHPTCRALTTDSPIDMSNVGSKGVG